MPVLHVRIIAVRSLFLLFPAVLMAQGPPQPANPIVAEAVPHLAAAASRFWQSAPLYIARETLKQRMAKQPKRHFRIGSSAVQPFKPDLQEREIFSWYLFSAFRKSPEALHEFRKVISVDGKVLTSEQTALTKFRATLESKDDWAKQSLIQDYEDASLAVAATDFGQLILLFTKANIGKYLFEPKSTGLVGAERAIVLSFVQDTGNESLHISDAGKQVNTPLTGELWLRESDYEPLRVTLTATRRGKSEEIRDEARVDYTSMADGTVLPASVVYRRYFNEALFVENISEYSDWRKLDQK